jgi:hypothetical protein
MLTPADKKTSKAFASNGGYFVTPSTSGFSIGIAGSVADNTYKFYYYVIGE